MAFKVGVLETDQRETDRPARKVKRSVADYLVRKHLARRISKFLIQMLTVKAAAICELLVFWDGPLGVGNLLPFSKPESTGDKLHYEMPHAGDRGMHRHGIYRRKDDKGELQLQSRTIRVSKRNLFANQAIA